MKNSCVVCGRPLGDGRSRVCRDHYRAKVSPKVVLRPHRCYECGKQLPKGRYKYCGPECREAARNKKLTTCKREGCGNLVKRTGNKFCSMECARAYAREKPCVDCGKPTGYGRTVCPDCHQARVMRKRGSTAPVLDERGRLSWY